MTYNGCSVQGRLENPSVLVKIILMTGAYGILILKQGSGLSSCWRVGLGLVSCKDVGLKSLSFLHRSFWIRSYFKLREMDMIFTFFFFLILSQGSCIYDTFLIWLIPIRFLLWKSVTAKAYGDLIFIFLFLEN